MHNNNTLSPFTAQQQQSHIQKQLLNLFTYYCSFADRQNYQYMKIQNFRRILLDAQLIQDDDSQQMRQVQILFSQAKNQNISNNNHSNTGNNIRVNVNNANKSQSKNYSNTGWIQFDTFISILPKIQQITNNTQNQPFKPVIQHLQSLYTYILDNTQFGSTIKYLTPLTLTQHCFILLQSLSPTLFLIYCNYFNLLSMRAITSLNDIFTSLTVFMKEYQLVPQVISKCQAYLIVRYVLELENMAESAYKAWFIDDQSQKNKHGFKYFDFVVFLMFVSARANRKVSGYQMASQFQRLVVFMQMMQVSSGFAKMCKKQQINMHLIPNQKLVKQLNSQYSSNQQLSFAAFQPQKISKSPLPLSSKPKPQSSLTLHPKLLQYYAQMHQQFLSFCLHGESIGTSFLSHKKCINVIKKLQLGIKQSEIQVLLASYSKVGLDFQNFLQFIQKINQKQRDDIQEIIQKIMRIRVIDQDLSQKLRNSRKSLAKMTRKQYRNCVAIIQLIQPILLSLFNQQSIPQSQPQHSSPNATQNLSSSSQYNSITSSSSTVPILCFISLSSYLSIMHSLQLSPLYLNKQSLIDIFGFSIKKSYSYMAFTQFKDSFIIALPYFSITGSIQRERGIQGGNIGSHIGNYSNNMGNSGNYGDIQVQTKMVVIVQRIGESRAVSKIVKNGGNKMVRECLSKVRQIFAQYYPKQMLKNSSSSINNSNQSSHRISQHSFS